MVLNSVYGDIKVWTADENETSFDAHCIALVIGEVLAGQIEGEVYNVISQKVLYYELIKD